MGIRDSAADDALVGDISVELVPISGLKSCTNKYMSELWKSECDEFLVNKLRNMFPNLKQKKKNQYRLIAFWSFLNYSFLFIEG